jgi:uncharacterized protein YyaL (SSP411 family)
LVYYSKEYLEKYFKDNYPVNWYTWLRDAFCSLKGEDFPKMNNNSDKDGNYNE